MLKSPMSTSSLQSFSIFPSIILKRYSYEIQHAGVWLSVYHI